MIRTRSRAELVPTRLMSIALAGALATGFIVGQLTPDIAGILGRQSSVHSRIQPGPALVPADDYAIRHQGFVPLGSGDDYATRHRAAASQPSLTATDDYANRH